MMIFIKKVAGLQTKDDEDALKGVYPWMNSLRFKKKYLHSYHLKNLKVTGGLKFTSIVKENIFYSDQNFN